MRQNTIYNQGLLHTEIKLLTVRHSCHMTPKTLNHFPSSVYDEGTICVQVQEQVRSQELVSCRYKVCCGILLVRRLTTQGLGGKYLKAVCCLLYSFRSKVNFTIRSAVGTSRPRGVKILGVSVTLSAICSAHVFLVQCNLQRCFNSRRFSWRCCNVAQNKVGILIMTNVANCQSFTSKANKYDILQSSRSWCSSLFRNPYLDTSSKILVRLP